MGGLYPCPDLVERVLAPKAGETVEMADLGTSDFIAFYTSE